MGTQLPGYPLRMPPDLRAWFDAAAKQNGRSLNSEIVHCLREFQSKQSVTPPQEQAA